MRIVSIFIVTIIMSTWGSLNMAEAKEWNIPVGITYVSGFTDIVDHLENNVAGVESVNYFPVGLSLQPYYQFKNGLGIGFGIGPIIWITGDVNFFCMPVNFHARYTFNRDGNISPYIRTGISTNIVSGDFVEDSTIGFLVGAGLNFYKTEIASMGVEIGFDSSKIEMETVSFQGNTSENIRPVALMLSLIITF